MEYLLLVVTYDNLFIILLLVAGSGLSVFYYGSLWLVVRNLMLVRRPKFLILGSFFGRIISTVGVFCLIGITMSNHWERLIACMAGFLLMRMYLIQYYSRPLRFSMKDK
ncbi:MAG: ATP synthase subunit I [wastewater metagenome]|nr:ATP synthase subunit I [Candidatus Loosdrechtia aerotolerans]